MTEINEKELNEVSGGAASGYFAYTVVKGDSLSKIAKRFNTTVQELVLINKIPNPDLIEVGQVLTVPTSKKKGWV